MASSRAVSFFRRAVSLETEISGTTLFFQAGGAGCLLHARGYSRQQFFTDHFSHGAGFYVQCLDVILKFDLIAGIEFRLRKDLMFCKEFFILPRSYGQGVRRGYRL